jgi:hypothetical protein
MKNLNTPEITRTLLTIDSEANSPSIYRDAILLPSMVGRKQSPLSSCVYRQGKGLE